MQASAEPGGAGTGGTAATFCQARADAIFCEDFESQDGLGNQWGELEGDVSLDETAASGTYAMRTAIPSGPNGCQYAGAVGEIVEVPDRLADPKHIAATYAARWEVELFFRELKTHYRIDRLPTRRRAVVFSSFVYDVLDVLFGPRRLRLLLARRLEGLLLHEAQEPNRWRLPLTERAQLGILGSS
jgi:IS4 transposase